MKSLEIFVFVSPIRKTFFHRLRRCHRIERFWIERTADPFSHVTVLLVLGGGQDIKQVLVSSDAAAILGRACPFAFQARAAPTKGGSSK